MGFYYSGFPDYVSVDERRLRANRKIKQLQKKGACLTPIVIEGRKIVSTFWGKAWASHIASYSDFDNRLSRGRSYVRCGAVIDLKIHQGEVLALVHGSHTYDVSLSFEPVDEVRWKKIMDLCTGKIASLVELLQGQFSKGIMEIMIHKEHGLFPGLNEITMDCSCFDYAAMCKHIAAVLYGIGARLDETPEELFLLRDVNPQELLASATSSLVVHSSTEDQSVFNNISELFDIDLEI